MNDEIQFAADRWLAENPDVSNLCGQAAMYLQVEAGLEPRSGWWNGIAHCWNVDDRGRIYDLTLSQFTKASPSLAVFAADSVEARWDYEEAGHDDLMPFRRDAFENREENL